MHGRENGTGCLLDSTEVERLEENHNEKVGIDRDERNHSRVLYIQITCYEKDRETKKRYEWS